MPGRTLYDLRRWRIGGWVEYYLSSGVGCWKTFYCVETVTNSAKSSTDKTGADAEGGQVHLSKRRMSEWQTRRYIRSHTPTESRSVGLVSRWGLSGWLVQRVLCGLYQHGHTFEIGPQKVQTMTGNMGIGDGAVVRQFFFLGGEASGVYRPRGRAVSSSHWSIKCRRQSEILTKHHK